ncbi:DUF4325 domain-containing protein [Mucilaginibacter sp. 10B2]|uniref:STAS-like domain-containing protein n=1 Tax=Mucilaginibacter sp. 10B2 TaxID=3048574 RepID=UPI002B2344F2|nr:DUF4325 domain-containing protein [Mucilaginibacter sp. 10B2]MEB0279896.1 DUF4325 domain-containing protein [Mucilaginibacter sp. 10B2]
MENTINIANTLKSDTILFPEEADKLFSVIKPFLEKGQKFALSFENLEDISSLFLNAFYGKIFRSYKSQYDELISVVGIDQEHDIFSEMIEKAKFLANNPRHTVSSRHSAFA